jgi:hypothetical protein
MPKSDITTPATTSALGVGTGYYALKVYTAQYQVILIEELLKSVFAIVVFAIGCFAMACAIGQWLQQNKENKKWSALVSYGVSTSSQGLIPISGASYLINQNLESSLQNLVAQYIGFITVLGIILLVIGIYIISTHVD